MTSTFVFTGRGFGHGIGLSQYGAQGYAQHGWAYEAILGHYYTGTEVTPAFPNDDVRVLIASGTSIAASSDQPFTAGGQTFAAGSYTVTPGAGTVVFTGPTTDTLPSPVPVAPAIDIAGASFRGTLTVASSGTKVAVLNTLPREGYLKGVVPREMPSSWEPEALKAQAVAARTYSLAGSGHCSWPPWTETEPVLCATTSDQVYGGKSAETEATNAAVEGTKGEVVTDDGVVPIAAYFFSTSGGRTATISEEWGGSNVSYLVSVPDPYDAISPHHRWGPGDADLDCPGTTPDCVFSASQVRAALGLGGTPDDLEVTARNGSGRVAELTVRHPDATLDGADARLELGLRSTWFSVGVLGLSRDTGTVTYGDKVTLAGLTRSGGTRGWGTASLERRRYGETAWTTITTPLENGAWQEARTPRIGTDFRVASGNAVGAPLHVDVRTRVHLKPPAAPYTRVSGTIGPARGGIDVTLERLRKGDWILVGQKDTTASGAFSFTVSKRGTYRAHADAGGGLLAGSAQVTLPAT